jgi:hypothetical protein
MLFCLLKRGLQNQQQPLPPYTHRRLVAKAQLSIFSAIGEMNQETDRL